MARKPVNITATPEDPETAGKYAVLVQFAGSPDGVSVVQYQAGEIIDLPESLASVAISEKWVKAV